MKAYIDFAVLIYKMLNNKLSNDEIYQIVTEAVEIEKSL